MLREEAEKIREAAIEELLRLTGRQFPRRPKGHGALVEVFRDRRGYLDYRTDGGTLPPGAVRVITFDDQTYQAEHGLFVHAEPCPPEAADLLVRCLLAAQSGDLEVQWP